MKPPRDPAWASTLERVASHRGCVRTLAHGPLAELAGRHPDPGMQAFLLAETIQRAWLFAAGEAPVEIARFRAVWERCGVPPAALEQWLAGQQTTRTFELSPALEQTLPAPLAATLGKLMHGWRIADGLIVWVRLIGDPAVLPAGVLPFIVRARHAPDEPLVTAADCSAEGLDKMAPGVAAANAAARAWLPRSALPPRIVLHTLDASCGLDLGGPSAGLAVLLAHRLRHAGLRVPTLELAGSGALAADGTLEPLTDVPAYERKRRLLAAIGVPTVVLPAPIPAGWPTGAPLTERLDALAADLRRFEEKLPAGALRQRVDELQTGMRYHGLDPKEGRDELRRLLGGQLRAPVSWLADARTEALLALAAAECHLGNAPACDEVLAELRAPGADIEPKYVASALVHQAVSLTDTGDYEGAAALCGRALDLAAPPAVNGAGNRDAIRLTACGTRGQAYTFLGMQPGREAAREQGLADLRTAARLADALDGHGHPADSPRNLAYLCLWHALHRPHGMQPSWEEAWEAAALAGSSVTHSHLQRYSWLGGYRAAKLGLAPCWPRSDAPLPGADGESWVRGTSLKYRGTDRAARGGREGAIADFTIAVRMAKDRHPVLRFIGATAALQAGESLRGLAPEESGRFLRQAVDVFERYLGWYAGPIAASQWLERARAMQAGQASGADPQRYFPY